MFFAFTDADKWTLGIGDPTFMGWLTVVAYFVAAVLTFQAARAERKYRNLSPDKSGEIFWGSLFLLLFALGVNKQLDLQTWFTLFMKGLAKKEGWYENRRVFQVAFIFAIAGLGLASLFILYRVIHKNLRQNRLALAGATFLVCFVLIRASSFHNVDLFLGATLGGMKMNWVLELGGIACVGYGAFRAWRNRSRIDRNQGQTFIWVSAGDRMPAAAPARRK